MTTQFVKVSKMIEGLRSEDAEKRLESMRGLHLIASTLGPERTRDELVPFLTDYLDENDAVLREFARALATMLDVVGGIEYVGTLLPPLELLCSLEDISVRDEATNSLVLIGQKILVDGTFRQRESLTVMAQKMASSETAQSRCTAAALIPTLYGSRAVNPDIKGQLLQAFERFATDDEVSVRRAACVCLGERFASVLGRNCEKLIPMLTALSRDSSDGVRLQAIPAAIVFLPLVSKSREASNQLLLIIETLAKDSSWRVKYMLADKLGTAAQSVSAEDAKHSFFPIFKILCKDSEPEIRASAVHCLNILLSIATEPLDKKELALIAVTLAGDPDPHTRMSLAAVFLKCVDFVPQDIWASNISGALLQLLEDNSSDVRLALVGGFSSLGKSSQGREIARHIVPVVVNLADDPNWRVRATVIEQLPSLIKNLGTNANDVVDVCISALKDSVASIRELACTACYQLLVEQGLQWGVSNLFPRVLPLSILQSPLDEPESETVSAPHNYLKRVTFCHFVCAIIPALDQVTVHQILMKPLLILASDPTSNVRINVARVLLLLKKNKLIGGKKELLDCIDRLRGDKDKDVSDILVESQ